MTGTIFYGSNGVAIGWRRGTEPASDLAMMVGAAGRFDFDAETNTNLLDDVADNKDRYSVVGGQLRKDGAAVTVNADSIAKQEVNDLLAQAANAIAANTTYLAIGSPNAAQNLAQIRALTNQNNRIIRRLVRLGRLREVN